MVQRDNARLRALVADMTLEEKIGQLTMVTADFVVTGPKLSADYLAAVRSGRAGSLLNLWGAEEAQAMQRVAVEETRLGIPLLLGFDVVHGHRTVFPVPLGEAAAFDPDLWERTAAAAALEAAADGINVTFTPDLDVSRDPRWGRIVEGPGEDAVVASRFGEAKLRGFQGTDLAAATAIAATTKHFGAYGAVLAGRDYASADVSERLLHEVYFPPFHAAVLAGTASIMPSFNDLAGVPVTANRWLLRTLAREKWGFDGVMMSDYNAITELLAHGVAADIAEAAALAIKAGVDLDMMGDAYHQGLPTALERGLVELHEIDECVLRVLRMKEKLGLFDNPFARGQTPITATQHQAHRALAREAARGSIVLLTNKNDVLPIAAGVKRIALLGPLADAAQDMLGPWYGAGLAKDTITWRTGLEAALPDAEITTLAAVAFDGTDESQIPAAVELAKAADLVILCIGESATMSGEASSRAEPSIPKIQMRLADAVFELGKPVVAVVATGRPLMMTPLIERADATLVAWHLGSESGNGLADILTGKAEPTGRLPISWPIDLGQVPIYFSRRPTGRPTDPALHYTSKYLDLPVEPLFPFGHGLGYTRFAWQAVRVTPDRAGADGGFTIEADIANLGSRQGTETAFLFIRDPVASIARPLLELKAFIKLKVAPGATATARFVLSVGDLAFPGAGPAFEPLLEPGTIEIFVGPCADHARLMNASVKVTSEI